MVDLQSPPNKGQIRFHLTGEVLVSLLQEDVVRGCGARFSGGA